MAAASDSHAFEENRLIYYLRQNRGRYFLGFVLLLSATFAALAPPFLVKAGVDAIDNAVKGERDPDSIPMYLLGLVGMIALVAIIESVARYYSRLLVSGTARHIEYQLRNDLALHLLRLDQRFYLGSRTGDLMARCTNDLQMVRDFTGPTIVDVTRTAVMVLVGLGFLFAIDVRLALISVAYLPVVGALVIFFETGVEKRFWQVQEQFGHLTDHAQENISGMRAIKAYAQEESEVASFRKENEEMMRRAMSLARYTSGLFPVMIFLTGAGTMLVIWFGGHDVVNGRISIGDFVFFNIVLALLASQLTVLGWVVAAWQQGIVATGRINEVLREAPEIHDPDDPERPERIRGEIEFRNVRVTYGGEPVLRDVDLHIPAGTTVALVGGTGAGKTTMANLLVRLLDPVEGTVLVDGIDIRRLSLEQLRGAIGFVPQESFLFSDSLRDNIALGRLDPLPEELEVAVETSQLINDLKQLDQGLDTVIGERGVTLSGGQKQRAALARALLKDPPILVLDDALSHVDTHTEEEILRRLRTFMRDRTTVLIAHRTSTLQAADFIVALEGNTIAEVGTHEELLRGGGVYARFFAEQRRAEQRESESRDVESARLTSGDGA